MVRLTSTYSNVHIVFVRGRSRDNNSRGHRIGHSDAHAWRPRHARGVVVCSYNIDRNLERCPFICPSHSEMLVRGAASPLKI
eukprot:scaffold22032_cov32-Prasinocladus_malaysianus.AAC.1